MHVDGKRSIFKYYSNNKTTLAIDIKMDEEQQKFSITKVKNMSEIL